MREEFTNQILNDQKLANQEFDRVCSEMTPGDPESFLSLVKAMQELQAKNAGLDTKLERRVAFTKKLLQEIK